MTVFQLTEIEPTCQIFKTFMFYERQFWRDHGKCIMKHLYLVNTCHALAFYKYRLGIELQCNLSFFLCMLFPAWSEFLYFSHVFVLKYHFHYTTIAYPFELNAKFGGHLLVDKCLEIYFRVLHLWLPNIAKYIHMLTFDQFLSSVF